MAWNVWSEEDLRAYRCVVPVPIITGRSQCRTHRGPTEAVVAGLAGRVASQLGAAYGVGESGIAGPNDVGRRFPA